MCCNYAFLPVGSTKVFSTTLGSYFKKLFRMTNELNKTSKISSPITLDHIKLQPNMKKTAFSVKPLL